VAGVDAGRSCGSQRDAEKPERIIILKARQLGFSTDVQATFTQRCTLIPYQAALTVAHDLDTAGKLFEIGQRVYDNLPNDPRIKPPLTHERDSKGGMKYMRWANGSTYEVETAGDIRGGRGTTPFLLHLSEIAHYQSTEGLIGLFNGVPDEPGSVIVQESTANGRNHFEDTWNDAVAGINGYTYIFVAWHEMPEYSLPFEDEQQREEFRASIGKGEIGEEEPMLLERFNLSLEQLNWRRYTIRAKLKHSPTKFKQEYPSYPQEAFLVSGRPVFAVQFTSRVLKRVEETNPLAAGPAPRRLPEGAEPHRLCSLRRLPRPRHRDPARRQAQDDQDPRGHDRGADEGGVRPDRGDRLQRARAPDLGGVGAPRRPGLERPPDRRRSPAVPPRPVRRRHRRRRRRGDDLSRAIRRGTPSRSSAT
jgi:hypothetical protein